MTKLVTTDTCVVQLLRFSAKVITWSVMTLQLNPHQCCPKEQNSVFQVKIQKNKKAIKSNSIHITQSNKMHSACGCLSSRFNSFSSVSNALPIVQHTVSQ